MASPALIHGFVAAEIQDPVDGVPGTGPLQAHGRHDRQHQRRGVPLHRRGRRRPAASTCVAAPRGGARGGRELLRGGGCRHQTSQPRLLASTVALHGLLRRGRDQRTGARGSIAVMDQALGG